MAAMLLTVSAFAQSGRSIYNKYSDEDGVSAVYISSSMFKLVGKLPDIDMKTDSGVNFSSVIKSLDGFYIINAEKKSVIDNLKKEVSGFIKSGHYEMLMEAKDNGDKMNVYIVGKDVLSSVVMVATEEDEYTFICIDGKISRDEFEKLLTEASK